MHDRYFPSLILSILTITLINPNNNEEGTISPIVHHKEMEL